MSPGVHQFISLDLPAMLAGTLAALSCGLLGNFLVLRRLSLMGDAISHAVLPGLVVAFLVSGLRSPLPMFLGAGAAGLLTVLLVEFVHRVGRVESGAAMGVVFSIMFALGVLLMEQAAARNVDLDAECVLHGQMETIFWSPPTDWASFLSWGTLADAPRQVVVLAIAALVTLAFVALLFKELRIAAFDPGLSTAVGIPAGLMHVALMVLVAAATVASFEAVGSILVVAMLICPAATARLLTDRLLAQLIVSALIAIASGVFGYLLGALGPLWIGLDHSISAAGMMTVIAGALLALAVVASPGHGLVARRLRRLRLAIEVAREDALGLLYRAEELGHAEAIRPDHLVRVIGPGLSTRLALRGARRRGLITHRAGGLALTEAGRAPARSVVRSHRLWESYLVESLGLRPDHVHEPAMRLEHLRRPDGLERLAPGTDRSADPHNRPIPAADPPPAPGPGRG